MYLKKYHRRWRQHRAITVETVDTVDTALEQNVGLDGWMGDGVDTPQTVMTTRAPAVLIKHEISYLDVSGALFHTIAQHLSPILPLVSPSR